MTEVEIITADVVEWAKEYQGDLFHAMLGDPPYHLTSILQRFGDEEAAPAKEGVMARRSAGFMGNTWDSTVAMKAENWGKIGRVLYPGAWGMAYGGSRTYHRMACAVEDAGFIIDPLIGMFGWAYGSGFTSPTRIDTRVENGADWEGHRYGADWVRPALEPICVFQKPFEGRPIDNITENGAGAIWVEGGRMREKSRYPSNLALMHAPGCVEGQCVEGCGVLEIGRQSGETAGGSSTTGNEPSPKTLNIYGEFKRGTTFDSYGDEGTAARYFHNADWVYEIQERLRLEPPVRYQAKPSTAEKETGLESFPNVVKQRVNPGGLENDPRFANVPAKNNHATVKPIAMAIWMARLLAPPPIFERRLLVPFCGSGSEIIGAVLSGCWEKIVGVELLPEYAEIARARVNFWLEANKWGGDDPKNILGAERVPEKQIRLF